MELENWWEEAASSLLRSPQIGSLNGWEGFKNSHKMNIGCDSQGFEGADSRMFEGSDSRCFGGSDSRFIPSRKESKYSVMLSSAHEVKESKSLKGQFVQNENDFSIAQLYKKHVLELDSLEGKKLKFKSSKKGQNIFKNNASICGSTLRGSRGNCNPIQQNSIEKMMMSLKSGGEGLQGNGQQPELAMKKQKGSSYSQYKVLDAPGLIDDFYLNLLDWSSRNFMAVGLGSQVYVWNGFNNRVQKVCDLGGQSVGEEVNKVQSVQWSSSGNLLGIGDARGIVQIFDANTLKVVQQLSLHSDRIGSLAWKDEFTLASGSRDKSINVTDMRTSTPTISRTIQRYTGHKQEVCGLKWSFDQQALASGGNDNKLFVWSLRTSTHVNKFSEHKAGVKALAWSPHQHGLLISGGGTADRTIRFWNTQQGKQIDVIESNSQVCNLVFSKNENEFVSTHGFQDNDIIVWKYPSLQKSACLTGHSCRVLQLGLSPCSTKIVTGAGDETLRFWDVFSPSQNSPQQKYCSLLDSKFDLR